MTHSTDSAYHCDRILYHFSKMDEPKKEYAFSVAILMRTKDRPLCLPRAFNSVQHQTFKHWQLIIINDGGNPDAVEKSLPPFQKTFHDRLTVIHNPTSLGMSRALNQGIDACSSEFIVVHDDDDSWEPDFLSEAVTFLQDPLNGDCAGVITLSNKVKEDIVNQRIVELEKKDFNAANHPCPRINLFRMFMQNTFPPISFLFKRSLIDKIGYFNEDLPVLNDWDFNLRCLYHYEIGVIPKHLANYHLRFNQKDGYGNSIIATTDICTQYETLIRNAGLRTILESEQLSTFMGFCLALGGHFLSSVHMPLKMENVLNNQQITLSWIEQNLRAPLAVDMAKFQSQLDSIQRKLDSLTHAMSKMTQKCTT